MSEVVEKNGLMAFSFEASPVRSIVRNGEPWFVMVDVCRILGLTNPTMASINLDEDEKHTLSLTEGIETDGRAQQLGIVSESGMYALIFRSRKAVAKKFRRWVTGEVLPAIRKTGNYGAAALNVGVCAELMERLDKEVRHRAITKLWKAKQIMAQVRKDTGLDLADLLEAEKAGNEELKPSARLLAEIRREVIISVFRPPMVIEGKT